MVMEQPSMEKILQAKKWDSIESIYNMEKLAPIEKIDMCTIFIDVQDVHGSKPEVFKVSNDVFSGQPEVSIEFTKEAETILGNYLLQSDEKFMSCLRQSQIDKKNGKTRKYEDIARECGLRL
jgi:predicted CoA-binding protein